MSTKNYYELQASDIDPKRLKREREKARELKKTPWWKQKVEAGVCHHCQKNFPPSELTLDHLVPLARGGMSTKNNMVPACRPCNAEKRLGTPAEAILESLSKS